MTLLAKLCVSGWLFFLAQGDAGLIFNTKQPSAEAANDGVCVIVLCVADNTTIHDVSYLESMSVYNISEIGKKKILATVSNSQTLVHTECVETHPVGVSGHFSSNEASIQLSIADQSACRTGMLTCELRYFSKEDEGYVIESIVQLEQQTRLDMSTFLLLKVYLQDVISTLETKLGGIIDLELGSCDTPYVQRPHYTTCDRPRTNLPREEITLPGDVMVLCDTETEGGGWVVIQRRTKAPFGNVNFTRDWESYKKGFGPLYGDFWLGNEIVYQLTKRHYYELRIDFKLNTTKAYFAKYAYFWLSGEEDGYRMTLGNYIGGTAPDQFFYHNHRKFSTFDRDNDLHSDVNCATFHNQGWWMGNCLLVALNGPYNASEDFNNRWASISDKSLPIVSSEMKIRPFQEREKALSLSCVLEKGGRTFTPLQPHCQ